MARIRTIKPDFFLDPDLSPRLTPVARLLFIGLWTLADRDGRLEDCAKRIGAQLFPYEPCDTETILADLSASIGGTKRRLIDRFEDKTGRRFIQIVNFQKHQRPHVREVDSTIPAPTEKSPRHNLGSANELPWFSDRKPRKVPSPLDKGKGMDNGEGKGMDIAALPPEEKSTAKTEPRKLTPQQILVRYFKEAKGVLADDKDWDRRNWNGRLGKEAAALLKVFDGDPVKAGRYMLVKGDEWKDLPDWTMNAIAAAAGRDTRLNQGRGENDGQQNGTLDADRGNGPRRLGGVTRSGEIAGDALAGLREQAALPGRGKGELGGSQSDSFNDEPFTP